jgi:hypothetical protein
MLCANRLNRASRTCSRLANRLNLDASSPPFQHTADVVGQIGNLRPIGNRPPPPLKNSTPPLPFQQFPWFDEIQQVEV